MILLAYYVFDVADQFFCEGDQVDAYVADYGFEVEGVCHCLLDLFVVVEDGG